VNRWDIPDLGNAAVDDSPRRDRVYGDGLALQRHCISRMRNDQFVSDGGHRHRLDLEGSPGLCAESFEEGPDSIQANVVALSLGEPWIEEMPDNVLRKQIGGGSQIAKVQPLQQ